MPKTNQKSVLTEKETKHSEIMTSYIKFLDQEMDADYLASLSQEQKSKLLMDLQIVTEWIKKVLLTIKK